MRSSPLRMEYRMVLLSPCSQTFTPISWLSSLSLIHFSLSENSLLHAPIQMQIPMAVTWSDDLTLSFCLSESLINSSTRDKTSLSELLINSSTCDKTSLSESLINSSTRDKTSLSESLINSSTCDKTSLSDSLINSITRDLQEDNQKENSTAEVHICL
jgi:hypothetical protein